VVVVASAMGDTTDELIDLASSSARRAPRGWTCLLNRRRADLHALLAMAIHRSVSRPARSPAHRPRMITLQARGRAHRRGNPRVG